MNLHHQRSPGLPASLRALDTPHYLHQTRPLAWKLMLTFSLLLLLAGLGFVLWRIVDGDAEVAEWILLLFLLPFMFVLLKPGTWCSPIAMAADGKGLYFIGGPDDRDGIFVPWEETGRMTIERHASGHGMIRTVVLEIADTSDYWNLAKGSLVMSTLLQPVQTNGCRRLPLGNMATSPKKTKAALEKLRSMR